MASFAIKIKQINLKWSISQAYIKGIWTQINLDFFLKFILDNRQLWRHKLKWID